MQPVRIRQEAVRQMGEHARREYPLECCGLLWGRGKVIEGSAAATNELRSPTEFRIPPRELIAFMKKIRAELNDFMGVYHSHPQRSATPSRRDAAEFHYREATYWIVSLMEAEPDIRCFRWSDGAFRETPYTLL